LVTGALSSQTHSLTAHCYQKLQHTVCYTQTDLSAVCIYTVHERGAPYETWPSDIRRYH